MILRQTVVAGVVASMARAAQPDAVRPVAAPMRDLRWGALNFLHTTDTHGWHGGHLQESQYSADWGDYISFAHHLRKRADDDGVDLLLVDTGDRVEGNGLYDASSPKGEYTYDIYKEQDIDIICAGNHELYKAGAANREHEQTVPNYKNNYLASNLDYIDPRTGDRMPMARRYRKFQTKNQKLDIVAFGFLFDFEGNANNTIVQPVEDTIKTQWFQEAIKERADVFVVVGHVGIRMDEFKAIFRAIRQANWFTPIVFLGGHAHVRDATTYDDISFALASGRYFETIGWLSVDGIGSKSADASAMTTISFHRRYIDNNLLGLYHHSGLDEKTFPTDHGRNISSMITQARKALSLDKPYGCAPKDYWMTRAPFGSPDSIYSWLQKEVLPDVVKEKREDVPRITILNTGTIRFDIFKGPFTRDTTYIVSPFTSGLRYIPNVPYNAAKKVMALLNAGGQIFFESSGLDSRFLTIPEQWSMKAPRSPSLLDMQLHWETGDQKPLGGERDDQPSLVGGYTTKDDIGTDGDDAVHEPINFYAVPNCFQAEVGFPEGKDPDTVDLVFLNFIQPWILVALKISGADYTDGDVEVYIEGTFTDNMQDWIKKNWSSTC